MMVASHAGDFRGARISSLPTRDEIRASLKTPAWEANMMVERVNRSSRCYSRGSDFFFFQENNFRYQIQNTKPRYMQVFTVYAAFLEEEENVKFLH